MDEPQETLDSDDSDSPWKDIIDRFFPRLLELFFPAAYADIDWSRPWESLDTELQQIVRDAERGPRVADKLVQVYTKSGRESRVFVHVEVQSQKAADFAERMFTYNYRIFDRFRGDVVSFGVLADENARWRPDRYVRELWGFHQVTRFPVVKLLDYRDRWQELEQSDNPFALLTMAHLKTRETRRRPRSRFEAKLNLVKWLYSQGYDRQETADLLRALDWMMTLPAELASESLRLAEEMEANVGKKYVTSWERIGQHEGRIAILTQQIRSKFGSIDVELLQRLSQRSDEDLNAIAVRLLTASSVAELHI
jgi:hypothetical protein